MKLFTIKQVTLSDLLSKIGGFWTAVSSVTVTLVSSFLYNEFMKREALIIQERQSKKIRGQCHDADIIMDTMKGRLSYVTKYEQFDRLEANLQRENLL